MKKIVIDISQLHPAALKRGVGYYARNLYGSLNAKNAKKNARKTRNVKYFLRKTQKEKYQADLIHYPYFDPFFLTLPRRRRTPIIVTVHDLTPLKFPKYYPAGIKGGIKWQVQRYLLKKVDAIITDSENSKKDIVDIIDYPEEKIYPIHLAVKKIFKPLVINHQSSIIKKKYHLPDIFLLYVGDLNWNKNLLGLIRAFSAISHQPSAISLILIGSAFENNNLIELKVLKKLINKLSLKKEVKLLGFVPTGDLVKIYNLATLYIQPSFYEGFGFPVLEAMSCSCPVLSSNQASLPEVGGKAVEYFNPSNKTDLERKIEYLLSNKINLKKLRKLGLEQAKKFSWRKTAEQTAKVYQKLLEK